MKPQLPSPIWSTDGEDAGQSTVSSNQPAGESHVKLLKMLSDRTLVVIVPMHGELASGTVKSIIRQANLTSEELGELGKI